MKRLRFASAFVALVATMGARPASADSLEVRDRLGPMRKHAPAIPANAPKHRFFGEIRALRGTTIVLRLRSGRVVEIDAAPALASGRYSAPLFVGKFVVVDGQNDVAGRMYAETITRLPRLTGITAQDR